MTTANHQGFIWDAFEGEATDIRIRATMDAARAYAIANRETFREFFWDGNEADLRTHLDGIIADASAVKVGFRGYPERMKDGEWGVHIVAPPNVVKAGLPALIEVNAKSGKRWTALIDEVHKSGIAQTIVSTINLDSPEAVDRKPAAAKPAAKAAAKPAAKKPAQRKPDSNKATAKQILFLHRLCERNPIWVGDNGDTVNGVQDMIASGKLTRQQASSLISQMGDFDD